MNFNYDGSYMDSPNWKKKKKKKATTNPEDKDDKCFQYAVAAALDYEEIKRNPEKVSNIEPLIKKHNWKGANYLSKIDDWKRLRKIIQQLLSIFYILRKIMSSLYLKN